MAERIHLYCLCWNDARMLPHFFRHYDGLVDRYFVFDNGSTDASLVLLNSHGRVKLAHFQVDTDSFVDEERRLSDTIWRHSRGEADWVVIVDIDEHLFHPDFRAYLASCSRQGVTALRAIGYEMVSDRFPKGRAPLYEQVTDGVRSRSQDKLCVFKPQALTETRFAPGRHAASPLGQVVYPEQPELQLLHFKQLGIDYMVARSAELRQGLKDGDIANGWGIHYTWSETQIAENWHKLNDAAAPVPGLGRLRHLGRSEIDDETILRRAGLVDEGWYLSTHPDVDTAGTDPILHFCAHGWKEGRKPCFYFDTEWYLSEYPEVADEGRNPLVHYATIGEREGLKPSAFFDPEWYRTHYGLPAADSPLRHFLQHKADARFSPSPDFDPAEYQELAPNAADLFEHYCLNGG